MKRIWRGVVSHPRQTFGTIAFVLGFVFTLILAFSSSSESPPSAASSVVLVIIASLFQAASVYLFSGTNRADPSLVRTAVRRLDVLYVRTLQVRDKAQDSFERDRPTEARDKMGVLSVELDYIGEAITESRKDWAEFHSAAVRSNDEEES